MDWYEEKKNDKDQALVPRAVAKKWVSAPASSTYRSNNNGALGLDVRLFYVRISSASLADGSPQVLTLRHVHRTVGAGLEINGTRVSSGAACLTLRRDRVDKESAEATYVSTDNVRTTGSLDFEVYDGDVVLVCGCLEKGVGGGGGWSMECWSAMGPGAGCTFVKGGKGGQQQMDLGGPSLEVYVAGCCSGSPLILTKTLQLVARRKTGAGRRTGTLDVIPEDEDVETQIKSIVLSDNSRQIMENTGYEDLDEKVDPHLGAFYPGGYIEGEEGELSWFNAGVRVGVGIGLGMCLGIGIGVGLLMRTYQATTRTFRRQLF